ncbi:response regulator transcription factor [Tepidibacter hydrothermalis]|uniref:Stage 0 sporulation protein A homolog n=1 Tax=Tepidibacter hydrothermalis TaxID=3036126 RepID=A0ABY8EBA8_9FIRM|nr:response regulator transcription factor [Tepidibacter hydrothermalis]WFD10220.1 response regulator transcription factor [Tepidibacter hydrothermalis]
MKEKILIAEDDKDISQIIELYLSSEGYEVTIVDNGLDGLNAIQNEQFDLAIFDIMMPEIDGFKLTREIRKDSNIPILIISAKSEISDKILGLNIGADDYITKPFDPLEVVARVNANVRRNKSFNELKNKTNNVFKIKNLTLENDTCRLFKDDLEITLTATEYKIMSLLMKNPNRIFSKIQIAEHLSGEYFEPYAHTITVHISHLREKIGVDDNGNKYIKTVKGLGYKIESN